MSSNSPPPPVVDNNSPASPVPSPISVPSNTSTSPVTTATTATILTTPDRRRSGLARSGGSGRGSNHKSRRSFERSMSMSNNTNTNSSHHSRSNSTHSSTGSSSLSGGISHSSHHTPSSKPTGSSNNPITNDVKLTILVHDKLEKITKYKQFQRWKSTFVSRFDSFLSESGTIPAQKSSNEMQQTLETCIDRGLLLVKYIEKGDLSASTGKKTVRASLSLKEFCVSIEKCRIELEELIPALRIDERRKGYSKFHIGSALIQAGFPQYVAMKQLEDIVHTISEQTKATTIDDDSSTSHDVLDRQQRDLFVHYETQVSRFCDVMADLDLYDIMLKCVEFFHKPTDDEHEDDVEELTIFVRRYNNSNSSNNSNSNTINVNDDDDDAFAGQPNYNNKTIQVDVEQTETIAIITAMVAEELGFTIATMENNSEPQDNTNLFRVRYGTEDDATIVENPITTTLHDLNVENGDVLTIEQRLILVTIVHRDDDGKKKEVSILIDPTASIKELKMKLSSSLDMNGDDPILLSLLSPNKNDNVDLSDDDKTCADYGIMMGSVLTLEPPKEEEPPPIVDDDEPLIIVDTKYGTMFSVNRIDAITKGVVTPVIVGGDGDDEEGLFEERTTNLQEKERLKKSMFASPQLKVKPQLVITKIKIDDYEHDGAADVKNVWGVQLKKTSKKQRGHDIFFVDVKTHSVGVLNRQKLLELEFITVVSAANTEEDTLEEGEKDQQKYDHFVREVRTVFGIAYEDSLGLNSRPTLSEEWL